jgi:hypothetical protein
MGWKRLINPSVCRSVQGCTPVCIKLWPLPAATPPNEGNEAGNECNFTQPNEHQQATDKRLTLVAA